jgi:hypothetical protein
MIKQVEKEYFVQEIDGQEIQIFYKDLDIVGDIITLPMINNKIECLHLNNEENKYSEMIAKIFVKVASLKINA